MGLCNRDAVYVLRGRSWLLK